jgi:gliding motility-associated-like protein
VNASPQPTITASQTVVCAGETISLSATGASNYSWSPIPLTGNNVTITPTSSMNILLTGGANGCTNNAVMSIQVIQFPTVSVNYKPGPYCSGSFVTFFASGAQNYAWSPQSLFSSPNGSQVTTSALAQAVTFTVDADNSSGNVKCPTQKTIFIDVIQTITPIISNSVSMCQGSSANLKVEGGNTYKWQPQKDISSSTSSNVIVSPSSSTVYSVQVSSNSICPVTSTVLVDVIPLPPLDAGQDTTINIGEIISLHATGQGIFKWSGEDIFCYECSTTQVRPITGSCYTVELTDNNGCRATDEICVKIINDFDVYVPNTFTPNEDGRNDVFQLYCHGIKKLSIYIYSRWGDLLYQSDDMNFSWDGTFHGEPCEIATYVYELEYDPYNGKHVSKAGHVNIVR